MLSHNKTSGPRLNQPGRMVKRFVSALCPVLRANERVERGEGIFADQIDALFEVACRKAGLAGSSPPLSVAAFRRPLGRQLSLFPGLGGGTPW